MVVGVVALGVVGLEAVVDLVEGGPVTVGKHIIPYWLTCYLKEDDLFKIESAIETAEMTTEGEIVPIIIKESGLYENQGPKIALMIFSFLSFIFFLIPHVFTWLIPSIWFLEISILLSVFFAWVLSPLQFVRRIILSKSEMEKCVNLRAELEFYRHYQGKTENKTAILILISIMEHRVVILADKTISNILPQNTWDGLVKNVVLEIKNKNLTGGLANTINECGKILSQHFPIKKNDKNELCNHLVIKE
jgi:putative membrane protein